MQVIEPERVWFDRFPWRWTVAELNFGYIVAILMLLGSMLLLLLQPFNIPSGSMIPTLLVGDYLNANTLAYGIDLLQDVPLVDRPFRVIQAEPTRGDVVFFRLSKDPDTIHVDRLVGLPGDRIQMREGLPYINDVAVKREPLSDFIGEDPCGSDATGRVKRWKETLPNGVSYETLDRVDIGFIPRTSARFTVAIPFPRVGKAYDCTTTSPRVKGV
jgi:signal peptidase I